MRRGGKSQVVCGMLAFLVGNAVAVAQDAANPKPLPPIRVSENHRYFVRADGTPFFWLGDTAWCIFNHPTPQDVDLYLDDRASKGFTVVQGCLAVWDYRTRPNPDGQTPFLNNDPGTPNEAYFKNVDSILNKAAARGLYMAVLPFWTKNTRTGPAADPEKMKAYSHFLGKRYATRNIFWVLGGDTAGTDIQPVTDAEAEGLVAGAKEAGVDKLMITYHPTGRQSSSFWFHERPWLDFNAIQSGHFINTTNFRLVADDWNKAPAKPTLDMEPGYENITDNLVRVNVTEETRRIKAEDVRRSAYLAMFAGAAGHTYGNGEVYEFWSPPSQGGRGNMPGWSAQMPWKEALKLPGSSQLQYLRYLIESRPMLDRIPDQSLIVDEVSNRAVGRVEATRAADGSYAFIYLNGQVQIDLEKLSGNSLKLWWYNPRNGNAYPLPSIAKSGKRQFSPDVQDESSPPNSDWVLVLDDASKNYGAPGQHSKAH